MFTISIKVGLQSGNALFYLHNKIGKKFFYMNYCLINTFLKEIIFYMDKTTFGRARF